MVFIRYCVVTAVWVFCTLCTKAQTVYYPAAASDLLRATAGDIALLLQKAVRGNDARVQSYSDIMPVQGIIFKYDAAVTGNQACVVEGDGAGYIKFSAAEDNGLIYGVYQYLQQLGFRFYLPGDIWEITPALSSPYKPTDTVFTCKYKYKTWFISGGHNRWIMDNSNEYPWENYFGDNGHQWALYQRRNNMLGAYRFTGHRGDLMTGSYMELLQNNPCYVAPYNGSRSASVQSVPDVNNTAAMQAWEKTIETKYTELKNRIYTNKTIYPNLLNNFSYWYDHIGIEVPDGANWANSVDNSGCASQNLLSESDQHFTLSGFVAGKINSIYPGKRFQLYAYDGHANPPSAAISINKNIDIQVVPAVYQSETTGAGLMNRWLGRSANISEYHYINLPQWSAETPAFFMDEMKAVLNRIKKNNEQGIVIETSPAKFASLPFLLAINAELKDGINTDETLKKFCTDMFGKASGNIYKLLQCWSDDKTVMLNYGSQDNKYKLPYYYELLQEAVAAANDEAQVVQQRLSELKAYLHYMSLYYDWVFDQRPNTNTGKIKKAEALCLYLAKINKLKIVNSYFLITDIVNRCSQVNGFFEKFNTATGAAYKNGDLSLLTAEEIETNYNAGIQNHSVQQYNFEDVGSVKAAFAEGNLQPLEKVKVFINYTQAKDYSARSEFYLYADKAGNFSIDYTPVFSMPGKGYVNFTVETAGAEAKVIKDLSINQTITNGSLVVNLPAAGIYKLTVSLKYKTALNLEINANGNFFYKNGPFLGNTIENYRGDLKSLPGYFHVPKGVSKIFFSLNNSNPGGAGFATPAEISKAFLFKDGRGNTAEPKLVSGEDSALFYLDVPAGTDGSFWQSYKMEQYRLCFANISNLQWYAARKDCGNAGFNITVVPSAAGCITRLSSVNNTGNIHWRVKAGDSTTYYHNQQAVDLPANISPNTSITLYGDEICTVSKILKDDAVYLQQLQACVSGGTVPEASLTMLIYPNPGSGLFNCLLNNHPVIADEITIYNSNGGKAARFSNTGQFNISHLQGGIYFYQLLVKGKAFSGRLIKQ
ncbi:MAG: T9SS type A sorting domain-containing protein [Ferruginibacter sp.]